MTTPIHFVSINSDDQVSSSWGDLPLVAHHERGLQTTCNRSLLDGPLWVVLVDRGETISGEPALFRRELDRLERRALERVDASGLPEPLSCIAPIIGPDFGDRTQVARVWYVPAGRSWGDEWVFVHDIRPTAVARRLDREGLLATIPPEVLTFHAPSYFEGELDRHRREVLDRLDWDELSATEREHYKRFKDDRPQGQPDLSLCVIFTELDESLDRMIRSICGHVDELVLVSTRGVPEGEIVEWLEPFPRTYETIVEEFESERYVAMPDGSLCIGNFARARQFSFELASGRWRMFLDADDTLEWTGAGPTQPLRDFVKRGSFLDRGGPQGLGFNRVMLPYRYSEGIEQSRAAMFRWVDALGRPIWRWDGCALHERVEPTPYLDQVRTYVLKRPADFEIVHHPGEGHTDRSGNRNMLVAEAALAARDYRADHEPRLAYSIATVKLASTDPEERAVGEALHRRVMEVAPADPYALTAGLDLARFFLGNKREKEVSALLAPILDFWEDERELLVVMGQAKMCAETAAGAARWFERAYFGDRPEVEVDLRAQPAFVELHGRIDASRCFQSLGRFDDARKVLDVAVEPWRSTQEMVGAKVSLEVTAARSAAAQAAQTLVQYYLSMDCVDRARVVADVLPVELRRTRSSAMIDQALEVRERHLVEPDVYDRTYEPLNEGDLVCGARRHMPPLVERIVAHRPDVFVDVGCNTGWVALAVASQLPECRVLGIDAGWNRVDESRQRAAAIGLDPGRVTFHQSKTGNWQQYAPLLRDVRGLVLVLCSEVIEHVPDPELFLAEIASGADRLLLTAPDIEIYHALLPRAGRFDFGWAAQVVPSTAGGEHVRCLDGHELVELCHEQGFDCERLERLDLRPGEGDKTLLFVDTSRDRRAWDTVSCRALDAHDQVRRVDILADGFINWGPRTHETEHVGGSEQAVAHLAPKLAELGFDVHVYARPLDRLEYDRGVWWHHYEEFRPEAERSCCIVWRRPERLLEIIEAQRGRSKTVLWCHDTPELEREPLYPLADEVWVLSQYQRELYEAVGVPAEKLVVLQNGVDRPSIERALEATRGQRQPHDVFWGSSADRGLLHLLRMWPEVRRAVPDARLFATYRTDILRHAAAGADKWRIADEVERLAVELAPLEVHVNTEGMPHQAYLELAARCGIWAGVSNFPEISCIVAMEVQALGLEPVATDFAALGETVLWPTKLVSWKKVEAELRAGGAEIRGGAWWVPEGCWSATYLAALVAALESEVQVNERNEQTLKALAAYDWARTAEMFAAAITAER